MKKLIAMLLCIAMVAALGVQAFAVELTNAEKAQKEDAQVAQLKKDKAASLAPADTMVAVEELYLQYYKEHGELKAAGADAKEFIKLDAKYKALIEKVGTSNATLVALAAANNDGAGNPFNYNPGIFYDVATYGAVFADYAPWDLIIDTANTYWNGVYDPQISAHELQAEIYWDLAADEAAEAAAAEAAAKLEAAAIKAAQAAVKDPKNSAEWMKYWAAYDKVYADKELKDAKTAAETAKKSVKTAQEAAFAQAKNAVEWAQAKAYDTMEQEITKAVNDYIVGVGAALTEFYAELYA